MNYLKGQRVTVAFDLILPFDCSEDQLLDWLRFETFANGVLGGDNPMINNHLDAEFESIQVRPA